MSAELLVNVTPRETRVALVENGVLQELMIERAARRGLVGNIFMGRVVRVLPGMQAAFVDIGLERTAFLHASDVAQTASPEAAVASPSERAIDAAPDRTIELRSRLPAGNAATSGETTIVPGLGTNFDDGFESSEQNESEREARPPPPARSAAPPIAELLREGQVVMVQVVKEPIGGKGARLTTHVAIPSCYLVYMPGADMVGVSQRIDDEDERTRLRDIVRDAAHRRGTVAAAEEPTGVPGPSGHNRPSGGYIVRTAAEAASSEVLAADVEFLDRMWDSIQLKAGSAAVPSVIHADLPLVVRTLREKMGADIERARIDSRETVHNMRGFCEQFIPEMAGRIDLYDGERPLFDLHGVEEEIQKALARKVELKSGGYLVIDQTEAMTTIDVNTGGYVGHRNLEETIFKTNLEATQAIARHLRLRNLGGIIIADFIDMANEEHKRQVLRALERYLERDHTRTGISDVSPLGLVQLTRKRTRESIEQMLCEPCSTCSGRGFIKTTSTVCYEIFRDIIREARQYDAQKLLIIAAPEIIETIVDDESAGFAELEAFVGKPITMQAEHNYGREHYDVVLV